LDHLFRAAEQFLTAGTVLDVQEFGFGNINDTFLVTSDPTTEEKFILQRINTHVFPRPEMIMLNMRVFTEHISERLQREQTESDRRWEVPHVLTAKDGKDYFVDSDGAFWRATSFVDASRTYETVQDIDHAREAGYALGRFHSLISDLETKRLYDTLEGFHITPGYLQHYDQVLAQNGAEARSPEVSYCLQFVVQRTEWASVLENAKAQGELVLRPIHGDPKVNNILIDDRTGQAVSIIDLDTVKPGLVHYDVGDCLRSCCNPLGEETNAVDDVHFEIDLCHAILQGYLSVANGFLSEADYWYLYDSVCLIPFELGLRFFTDYLEGNVYFKAKDREHNLMRALVQFRLTESIESQQTEIRTILKDLT
jgi:hypothetical protein